MKIFLTLALTLMTTMAFASQDYFCSSRNGIRMRIQFSASSIVLTGSYLGDDLELDKDGFEYVDVKGNLLKNTHSKLPDKGFSSTLKEDWGYVVQKQSQLNRTDRKNYQVFGVLDLYHLGSTILSEYGGYLLVESKLANNRPAASGMVYLLANSDSGPGDFMTIKMKCIVQH